MAQAPSRIWSPFCRLPDHRADETVTIVEGEGCHVVDDAGRRYLDAMAGLWYVLVGYGRTEIAEAMAAQARRLHGFKTHGEFDNPPARELADELAALLPVDDPLAFFSCGGGDAIETACKMARAHFAVRGLADKRVVLTRAGAYHGMQGFGSAIAGIDALRAGNEDGYPSAVVAADDVDDLRAAIERIGAGRIAAFVAEPVIGAGGIHPPAPGYLTAAEEVCREHDVLFVCDEVVTGFGRLGTWSGAEHYGLRPDIAVLAKGITSGYAPLGATVASRRVWEPFAATGEVFRHGYTYAGHPTACAAALANLAVIRDEGLLDHAAATAPQLAAAIEKAVADLPFVTEVRSAGMMAGVGLDPEPLGGAFADGRADLGEAMVARLRAHGVIVRRTFGGDLQISPPLVAGPAEIDELGVGLRAAAADLSA